jgi:hypothetical protein
MTLANPDPTSIKTLCNHQDTLPDPHFITLDPGLTSPSGQSPRVEMATAPHPHKVALIFKVSLAILQSLLAPQVQESIKQP